MEDKKKENLWEHLWEMARERRLPKKDSLVILLLCGVLLLVIAIPVSESGREESGGETSEGRSGAPEGQEEEDYADYLEKRLEETLSHVSGVGRVEVMVTLGSTSEKVIEKDRQTESESVTEEDSQGGARSTIKNSVSAATVYDEGDDNTGQTPYVTKELSPAVEGVVVIAEGGDEGVVVENITEAVQALFGVDTHKIKVMKLNEK